MSLPKHNRRFIVLINPISGTKSKDAKVNYIQKKLAELQYTATFEHTKANGDYNWLLQKIELEKITDVIIIGGDGTINNVVNYLSNIKINIGIIPSGSGNGLAFTLGIPKDYKKALDIILHGITQTVDGFLCNKKFSCMLCGIGFDAQVAHDFANQKTRGLITYAKQSFKNYIKAKAYPFTIKIDNQSVDTEAFFISIANSNQFGNHFTIAPKASLSDGLLDIVIVQKMSKLKLPFALLQQLRGKNKYVALTNALQQNNIVYLQANEIFIENKSLAPLHIDGEVSNTSSQFHFKIIKKCFKVYAPQ
jgi:diacylglycerol kinase (ATP)